MAFAFSFFKKENLTPEEEMLNMFKTAIYYTNNLQYKHAEALLHKILQNIYNRKQSGELNDIVYFGKRARIFSELGNLYLLMNQYSDAESVFKEMITDCMACGLLQTDVAIIEVSLKLAFIYEHQKQFDKAETGYQFCIDALETKFLQLDKDIMAFKDNKSVQILQEIQQEQAKIEDKDKLLLISDEEIRKKTETEFQNIQAFLGLSCSSYARFLHQRGNLKDSLYYFQRALQLSTSIYGNRHANTASLLNDIACIYADSGQLSSAIDFSNQAIFICQLQTTTSLTKEDKQLLALLPLFYNNLAEHYMKMGNFNASQENCTKAVKLLMKFDDGKMTINKEMRQELLKEIKKRQKELERLTKVTE